MNGSSKLVETLADSLLNEFSKSKDLSLMNDVKFSEITDLLWEILDRQDKAEDREKKKSSDIDKELERKLQLIENQIKKANENISNVDNADKERYSQLLANQKELAKLMQGGEEPEETDKKDKLLLNRGKTKKQKEYEEDNERRERKRNSKERTENERKIRRSLDNLKKDFKKGEKRNERRSKETLRGLKKIDRKVGSIIYKVFNKLKAFLLVGLAVLFAKPIWNALKESIKPIWKKLKPKVEKWFNDLKKELSVGVEAAKNALKEWFKTSFPKLNEWLEKEYPKVKDWVERNWEDVKSWFTETLPMIIQSVKDFLDNSAVGRFLNRKMLKSKEGQINKNILEYMEDDSTEGQIKLHKEYIRLNETKKQLAEAGEYDTPFSFSEKHTKFLRDALITSFDNNIEKEQKALERIAPSIYKRDTKAQNTNKETEERKAQYQQQQDELAAAYASRSAESLNTESLGASAPQQGGGLGGNVFVTNNTTNNTMMEVKQIVEESIAQ